MNLYNPGAFQGSGKNKKYFEGWYYKNVSADLSAAAAFIPGISVTGGEDAHSFIQVFDGAANKAHYFRFASKDFVSSPDKLHTRIGNNIFTASGLSVDLSAPGVSIKAELKYTELKPWPVSFFSPGVMGWYGLVPFMECYHGVLGFNHVISGWVEINGIRTSYDGGKGYLEKDWGTSMPSSWIWAQGNNFSEPQASVFVSVARIPFLGGWFPGFIAGFYLRGKIYMFATYTGAKLTAVDAGEDAVRVTLRSGDTVLELEGTRAHGVELPAPVKGQMSARVTESLSSSIRVKLTQGGAVLFEGESQRCGVEFKGTLEELRKK